MRSNKRSQKALLHHLKFLRWKKKVARTLEPEAVAKWIDRWIELDHCITTNNRDGQRRAANEIASIFFRDAK